MEQNWNRRGVGGRLGGRVGPPQTQFVKYFPVLRYVRGGHTYPAGQFCNVISLTQLLRIDIKQHFSLIFSGLNNGQQLISVGGEAGVRCEMCRVGSL